MSRSSSQSQANQTTVTQDQRVAADNGAVAVSGGSTLIQENLSDDVAIASIEGNTDVSKTALTEGSDLARDVNRDSLDFAGRIFDTGADAIGRVTEKVAGSFGEQLKTITQSTSEAIANLEKNKRDPTDDTIQSVAKYGAVALAVVAVGYFLTRKS